MDDENEALDWGNEEDEYQESPRRLSHNSHSGRDRGQQDDVEDTISLGDEEEESGFYPYSRHDPAYVKYAGNDPPAGLPSHKNLVATGAKVHNKSQEAPEQSNVKVSVASSESPTRSTRQSSPQRSLPRLTHALPPKPVAPKVPVLPPSHPSIIAATSMTTISPHTAGSEIKKLNGNSGKSTSQQSADDLPQDWETRHSRKGELYYYNRVTHECVWTHPNSVAAPEGTTSRRRSHSASSVGNRQITSHDSNTDHLKTTSDTPHSEPPASEIQAERRLTTSDVHGLTYEDRHYRPGEPVSTEVRLVDRSQNLSNRGRYDGSLSPHRRRPRSNSPASARGTREKEYQDQRSTRGRDTFVNPISPASKVTYVSDLTDDDRFWPPLQHPAKFSRTEREQKERSTRLPREGDQIDNKSGRPVPKKEEIGHERRGRSGDRNPTSSRMSDVPESSANQTYSSAQSTLSASSRHILPTSSNITCNRCMYISSSMSDFDLSYCLSKWHVRDSSLSFPVACYLTCSLFDYNLTAKTSRRHMDSTSMHCGFWFYPFLFILCSFIRQTILTTFPFISLCGIYRDSFASSVPSTRKRSRYPGSRT